MKKGSYHSESMLYTRAELEEYGYMGEAIKWMDETRDITEIWSVDGSRRVTGNVTLPLGMVVRHLPTRKLLVSAVAYRIPATPADESWTDLGGGSASSEEGLFIEGTGSVSTLIYSEPEVDPCSRCGSASCPRLRGGKWALCRMDASQRPLSQREAWSCVDDDGLFRCPSCGKFAKSADITRDNLVRTAEGGIITLTPRCAKCE